MNVDLVACGASNCIEGPPASLGTTYAILLDMLRWGFANPEAVANDDPVSQLALLVWAHPAETYLFAWTLFLAISLYRGAESDARDADRAHRRDFRRL